MSEQPTQPAPHDHLKEYAIGAAIATGSAVVIELFKHWLEAGKRASYCECEEDDE